MVFQQRLMYRLLLVAALVAVWVFGCGDDSTGPDDGQTSAELVAEANDSLGTMMTEIIEETLEEADSTFRPRDIDFSKVHDLYERALARDNTNQDARFGSAFTGLMMYLTDPTLNDLIDRFKYVIDTSSVDGAGPVSMLPRVLLSEVMSPEGIPAAPEKFPALLPAFAAMDHAVIRLAAVDPMISEIQATLETGLLPRVVSARNKMLQVLEDAGYTFVITPAMQGNHGANPIILDRSDFRVFLAALYAAEASLHIFLARNLDMTSYDVEGVEDAVTQSSGFLRLKSGGVGANHMLTAKTRILSTETELENAIDHLIAEIGTDQSDDLIKVYTDDLEDLNEAKDTLNFYRTYFDGAKELEIVFDAEDTLRIDVDISQFFDNPIDNPKELLPAYTITMEHLEDYYEAFAAEHFSRDRYWAAMDTIFGLTYPNDTPYFDYHLPEDNSPLFYQLLAHWEASGQFIFGWEDVYKYTDCEPPATWCYYSQHRWTYERFWHDPDQIVTCWEWQATSYHSWTWPNPTFNGLFPSLTSEDIKDMVVDEPSEWKRGECDTTHFEF